MSNRLLYTITVLIWGSTWYAIEFQLGMVAPEVSIVYRYAGAAALLFVWSLWRRIPLRFHLRSHGWFLVLGSLLFSSNYVFAYRAQEHISSALTAIVFSTLVWLNIVNARIFFGVRSSGRVLLGAALGVLGILFLFAPQVNRVSWADGVLLGSGLAFIGALLASFGNLASQSAQSRGLPLLPSNAWGMFYGAVLTAVYAKARGHAFVIDWSAGYLLSLGYLTLFGSVIAFGAYLTLIGRIGAHRAGYAMVMFPMVALLFSVFFEGLELDWKLRTGVALVLIGNFYVLHSKRPGASAPVGQRAEEPCSPPPRHGARSGLARRHLPASDGAQLIRPDSRGESVVSLARQARTSVAPGCRPTCDL